MSDPTNQQKQAWIAGGQAEAKKEAVALVSFITAETYVKWLKEIKMLEEKLRNQRFLYTQDKQAKTPSKVEVDLPTTLLQAQTITPQLAAKHAHECSASLFFGADQINLAYSLHDNKPGMKVSCEEKAANTREGLTAQYLRIFGVIAAAAKQLKGDNKTFKVMLVGESPKHEKLSTAEIIALLKKACVDNNLPGANFWGEDFTNNDYNESLDAELSQAKKAAAMPAGFRLQAEGMPPKEDADRDEEEAAQGPRP